MVTNPITVRLLSPRDTRHLQAMLTMFGEAFEDMATWSGARPDHHYLAELLRRDHFIALAALNGEAVVGGLVAYVLDKIEQARKEIYIYDLAVRDTHRRSGVATGLIEALKQIGRQRGAYGIFVQADHGDDAAIALYTKMGKGKAVLQFDIAVD